MTTCLCSSTSQFAVLYCAYLSFLQALHSYRGVASLQLMEQYNPSLTRYTHTQKLMTHASNIGNRFFYFKVAARTGVKCPGKFRKWRIGE